MCRRSIPYSLIFLAPLLWPGLTSSGSKRLQHFSWPCIYLARGIWLSAGVSAREHRAARQHLCPWEVYWFSPSRKNTLLKVQAAVVSFFVFLLLWIIISLRVQSKVVFLERDSSPFSIQQLCLLWINLTLPISRYIGCLRNKLRSLHSNAFAVLLDKEEKEVMQNSTCICPQTKTRRDNLIPTHLHAC